MVKRESAQYVCRSCGATSSSWSGRCYACGEWNTLDEQIQVTSSGIRSSGRHLEPQSLNKAVAKDQRRLTTNISDIDQVLGGGLVVGSVNLLAGQPGVGKSTLLLQVAESLVGKKPTLYVSGEESAHQVGLRAKRLGLKHDNLQLATSNSADDVARTIMEGTYQAVIVDSIQTLSCSDIASAAGSPSQITNSTAMLSLAAKQNGTALILVGHVTKEGSIAGPKLLEHVVDVVLQLEGESYDGFKILRATKNRYGPTNETAIFEMAEKGLVPVSNPSEALLAERQVTDGSIVLATMEGSRPLLVEVQALVNRTSYGYPKRAASGIDLNRVNLLVAMLERRTKLNLSDQDIYINIVGGIRVTEPAADLAIIMAIASAARGMQLKKNAAVFGEVGLSGELRHVPYADKRLLEAKKLGLAGAIGPIIKGKQPTGYTGVPDVRSALNTFLEKG